MLRLLRLVTKIISSTPAATASSTIYCNVGLSTSGSISLGMTLLAGSTRVPRPATGNTALRICIDPPDSERDINSIHVFQGIRVPRLNQMGDHLKKRAFPE